MNKKYTLLIISIGLILVGFIPMFTITHFNVNYNRYDLTLSSKTDGIILSAWLYVPNPAPTDSDPVPGVVVCHGFASSKISIHQYSSEIAKRGIVVIAFDFRGHGNSEGYLDALRFTNRSPLIGDCLAAINHLQGLNYVDNKSIALVGHSMGAFTSMQTSAMYYNYINTTIAIGSILQGHFESEDYINTSRISNLMLGIGKRDELFSVSAALNFLANITDGIGTQSDTLYGNFSYGNATKLVISPYSDHEMEIYDTLLTENIIIWLENAFFGGLRYPVSLSTPMQIIFMIISFMGISMGFFPVISLTRDFVFKKESIIEDKKEQVKRLGIKLATTKSEKVKSILYYSLCYSGGMGIGLLLQVPIDILFESAIPKVFSDILLGMIGGMIIGLIIAYILIHKVIEKDNTPITRSILHRVSKDFRRLVLLSVVFFLYVLITIGLFIHYSLFDMIPTLKEFGVILIALPIILLFFLLDELIIRRLQDKLNFQSTLKEVGIITIIGSLLKMVFFIPIFFLAHGLILMVIEPLAIIIPLMQGISAWMYTNSRRNCIVSSLVSALMVTWILIMMMPFGCMSFPIF